MNAIKRWRANKRYLAKLNLLAKIRASIEPQLAIMRQASDLLDRYTRKSMGIDLQGYSVKLGECSRLDIHTLGNLKGTESLIDAESFETCVLAGMDKAEQTTRNIADNN